MAQFISSIDGVIHQEKGVSWHCELPSASDPTVNQTLYAKVGECLIILE